jgi:hypothetical protein
MKDFDKIPIWHFITTRYLTPQIQKIVESWRVEPTVVIEKLNEHFKDLGLHTVSRDQDPLVMQTLIFQLKNSPEISKLLAKNRQDELRRQRNRHAD